MTPESAPQLAEFVDYIGAKTTCRFVSFEPVGRMGRAKADDRSLRVLNDFAVALSDAKTAADRYGIEVAFSSCPSGGVRRRYCGAYGPDPNFCVSTEGVVSSCYGVLDPHDNRAEFFVYGKFDPVAGEFEFDDDMLLRLAGLDVESFPRCSGCYAKWTCGGECLSRTFSELGGIVDLKQLRQDHRCHVTRLITVDEISRRVRQRTKQASDRANGA